MSSSRNEYTKINNDIDITFSVEWTIMIYLYASCILCNPGP